MVGDYLKALESEITGVMEIIRKRGYKIQSIYIGGGTPTAIDASSLNRLLEFIENNFNLDYLEEYTLEAGRPDSIDVTKRVFPEENRIERAFNVKNVEHYVSRVDEMVERKRNLFLYSL
jgi:coproporphyrinogen III oxidase-like Fe-S oxidoreductase